MKNTFLRILCIAVLIVSAKTVHGQVMYNRTYLSPTETVMYGSHLQTLDGGMVFLSRNVQTGNVHSVTVFKTDADGVLQWEQHIVVDQFVSMLTDIVESPDSSYFFTGVDVNSNYRYLLVRISPAGAIVLYKEIRMSSGFNIHSEPVCMARNDGSFLVASTLVDLATSECVWHLMNIDYNGNVNWSKEFNRMAPAVLAYPSDIDTCSNGDIVLLGQWPDTTFNFFYGACVCRITVGGTLLWSKAWFLNGRDFYVEGLKVMPGDFIFVSGTADQLLSGFQETFVMRLTGQGYVIWTSSFGARYLLFEDMVADDHNLVLTGLGVHQNNGFGFEIDSAGTVAWGKMYRTVLPFSIDHSSHYGYTIAAFGPPHGVRVFTADTLGNSCSDSILTITRTPLSVYSMVIGNQNELPVPDTAVTYTTQVNPLVTTTICLVGIDEYATADFKMFPNPAHDACQIHSEESILTVQVFDVNGRILEETNVNSTDYTLQTQSLLPGLYLVRIQTDSGAQSVRLVIE